MLKIGRRASLLAAGLGLAAGMGLAAPQAQDTKPSGNVEFIVPLAPGGGIDTAATKTAIRLAQAGELVGMFPEGRINDTDAHAGELLALVRDLPCSTPSRSGPR